MFSTDAPSTESKYISRIYGARYLDFTGVRFVSGVRFRKASLRQKTAAGVVLTAGLDRDEDR